MRYANVLDLFTKHLANGGEQLIESGQILAGERRGLRRVLGVGIGIENAVVGQFHGLEGEFLVFAQRFKRKFVHRLVEVKHFQTLAAEDLAMRAGLRCFAARRGDVPDFLLALFGPGDIVIQRGQFFGFVQSRGIEAQQGRRCRSRLTKSL